VTRHIVEEAQLREVVGLDLTTVDVIERAFKALKEQAVVMPPVLSMELPAVNAEVDIKTAFIPGFDGFAIKVSPGFFNNPSLGLASLNGLMIVLSAKTGLVEAVLLDNGYLTDVRTAAAGAVAAKYLAPDHVGTLCVMGTGVQARLQAQAAALVRNIGEIKVWGRDYEKAVVCASELEASLGIPSSAIADAEEGVRTSQLVVTTTPSAEPLVDASWLHPGLHITAMGSDQESKNELAAECLRDADLYVCDRVSQAALLGELRTARAHGFMDSDPAELSDVVTGRHRGRRDQSDITIADLTGMGVQDTAIASHALSMISRSA